MSQLVKRGLVFALLILLISACRLFSLPTTAVDVNPTKLADNFEAITEAEQEAIPVSPSGEPVISDNASKNNQDQPHNLLPFSLYYLSAGTDGTHQIWRMESNAKDTIPITLEEYGVDGFDISIDAGKIAYLTNNQIIISDLGGKFIRSLVVSQPNNGEDDWFITNRVSVPKWSPDGNLIAYGLNGLVLSNADGSNTRTVLQNEVTTLNDGYTIIKEGYSPHSWSPDGKKLLVNILYFEGGSKGLYYPEDGSFLRLSGGDLCCFASWAPDSNKIYTSGKLYYFSSDMWEYSAATGHGTQLIPEKNDDGTFNFADFPFATDTHLFYGYASFTGEPPNSIPLTIYNAPILNPAENNPLRSDAQFLTEMLWAPDASLVLGVQPPPGGPVYPNHGPVVLIYPDDTPIQPLLADGYHIRWGP